MYEIIRLISEVKNRNHMVFSIDAKRIFEKKNPHVFMVKVLKKVGIKGMYSTQ